MGETKTIEITIKAQVIEEGNERKLAFVEYKHEKHPGYDILAILNTVQAETMIKAKPANVENDTWLKQAVKISANALYTALAARLADMDSEE